MNLPFFSHSTLRKKGEKSRRRKTKNYNNNSNKHIINIQLVEAETKILFFLLRLHDEVKKIQIHNIITMKKWRQKNKQTAQWKICFGLVLGSRWFIFWCKKSLLLKKSLVEHNIWLRILFVVYIYGRFYGDSMHGGFKARTERREKKENKNMKFTFMDVNFRASFMEERGTQMERLQETVFPFEMTESWTYFVKVSVLFCFRMADKCDDFCGWILLEIFHFLD